MAGIAEGRLREERRSWRKDHPIGFVARPRSKADGSTDLLNWDVVIPGKKDTMWEGCEFNLTMEFSSDYPATAPVVKFVSRPGEVESCVGINAIEQTQLRRRYRVDGVGRPKFDFHTGLLAPERVDQRAHLPQFVK